MTDIHTADMPDAECLPPQRFGNCLAIYNETLSALGIMSAEAPNETDVHAARMWAFNAGAAPLEEWYPAESHTDEEGNTWTVFYWD